MLFAVACQAVVAVNIMCIINYYNMTVVILETIEFLTTSQAPAMYVEM